MNGRGLMDNVLDNVLSVSATNPRRVLVSCLMERGSWPNFLTLSCSVHTRSG